MTHDEIFDAYIDDKCPECGAYKSDDDYHGICSSGGKVMSLNFECHECNCVYVVGFNRSRNPIESEIIISGKSK